MALMPGFEPAWATLVGGKCSHHCAIPCFPCCFLIVMKIATLMRKKKTTYLPLQNSRVYHSC